MAVEQKKPILSRIANIPYLRGALVALSLVGLGSKIANAKTTNQAGYPVTSVSTSVLQDDEKTFFHLGQTADADKIAAANAAVADAQQQAKTLQAQADALNQQIQGQNGQISDLESQLTATQAALAAAQAKAAAQQSKPATPATNAAPSANAPTAAGKQAPAAPSFFRQVVAGIEAGALLVLAPLAALFGASLLVRDKKTKKQKGQTKKTQKEGTLNKPDANTGNPPSAVDLELAGKPAAASNAVNLSGAPTGMAADLSKMDAMKQDYPISFGPMPARTKPAPKASAEEIAALRNKLAEITIPEGEAASEAAASQQPPAAEPAVAQEAVSVPVVTDEERIKRLKDAVMSLMSDGFNVNGRNDKGHILQDRDGKDIAVIADNHIAVHKNVASGNDIHNVEAMQALIKAAALRHPEGIYANNASDEMKAKIAAVAQQMIKDGKLKVSPDFKFEGKPLVMPAEAAQVVSLDNAPAVIPPVLPPVPAEPVNPNYRATLDQAAAQARTTNQTNSTPIVPPAAPAVAEPASSAKSGDYLWTVKPGNGATYKVKKSPSPAAGM